MDQLLDRRFCRNTSLQAVCDAVLRSRVLRVVCPHEGWVIFILKNTLQL